VDDRYSDKSSCTLCSQLDGDKNVVGTDTNKSNTSFSELKQELAGYRFEADSSATEFIFGKDNTFRIRVVAAAPNGKIRKLKQQTENSPCPRKSELENYDKQIAQANSIDRLFGPFPGNIFDKELKLPLKTDVFKTSDGKGVTTESLQFSFSR